VIGELQIERTCANRKIPSVTSCLLFVSFALSSLAQTVQPLIDENVVKAPGRKCSGRIEYINNSLRPLSVVLDARSFTVSDLGELTYRPLDGDMHLKLSTMSFRIAPQNNYFVFYEAWSDKLPGWFVVYATFSGYRERTAEGFNIQVQLPHTVYLLPKQTLQKRDVSILKAEYNGKAGKVILRVKNSGLSFGRVLEADVTSGRNHATQGGFPLFPLSDRQVEIPWAADEQPQRLRLRFVHFSAEGTVHNYVP